MSSPLSTDLVPRVGEIWKETDTRFNRHVVILTDHGGPKGKVQIQAIYRRPETIEWKAMGPRRWASAKRFNNKSGGYKLVVRSTIT